MTEQGPSRKTLSPDSLIIPCSQGHRESYRLAFEVCLHFLSAIIRILRKQGNRCYNIGALIVHRSGMKAAAIFDLQSAYQTVL